MSSTKKTTQSNHQVTAESVKALIKKKDEMEKEMEIIVQSLNKAGVGVSKPLVDKEGFPRSDVDLYEMRGLRHRYASILSPS